MRNGQNGRRRGRGGPGGSGGGPRTPSGGRSPDMGNRNEVRVRGNAHQLLEKYKQLARDASMQGDRVSAEYYLQYADHYYRVLNEFRARQEEQQARQQNNNSGGNQPRSRDERDYRDGNDNGDEYGDDDGDDMIENAAPMRVSEMTRMIPEPQAEVSAKGSGDRDGDERDGGDRDGGAAEASKGDGGGEADGGEGEDGAPRRRRARGRGRPRRETADEGELAPVDA